MPQIKKESVREQFDEIKQTFEALTLQGKVSADSAAIIKSLILLFEIVLAVFMEKQTKKTSKNSGIPSSKSEKDDTAREDESDKKKRTNQKEQKETGETLKNMREVVNTVTIEVNECTHCGTDLSKVPCDHTERRTQIDIVFEKVVTHEEGEHKTCPTCNEVNKPEFSPEMHGPLQYGPGINAFIITLVISQMVAIRRVKLTLAAMCGIVLSETTILSSISRLNDSLAQWEEDAKSHLIKAKVLNVDETTIKINKKKWYIHVYASGGVTCKFLHKNRGHDAINEINILPQFKGVAVHDCLIAYFSYENCTHAVCGPHLVRELQFIIESNNYRWAKRMKKLLLLTRSIVAKAEEKKLPEEKYQRLVKLYQTILTYGEKELPPVPPRKKGQRGKIAKTDAANLHERLLLRQDAVLRFACDPLVPFSNNRAERDLRMAKVKQKVSGTFRTERFAKAYCRISSYLQTAKYHQINPLVAIQMALAGKPFRPWD